MRAKKSKYADLETRRKGYLLMGLTVACALSLTAFEWQTHDRTAINLKPLSMVDITPIDVVPPFRKEQPIQKAINPDKLIIVDLPTDPFPEPEPETIEPLVEPSVLTFDPLGLEPELVDTMPFVFVEQMPEFIGGEAALFRFLSENIEYPQSGHRVRDQGTVYVEFIVGTDGRVRQGKLLKGINKKIDEEVLRVVDIMPKWKPGKQNGRAVNVRFSLPVKFRRGD